MQYSEFVQCIRECVTKKIGKEGRVDVTHVIKNNGLEYDGIIIIKDEEPLSPTVYLDTYYERYTKGEELEKLAEDIIVEYEKYACSMEINPEVLRKFDEMSPKIMLKLVNYERNNKMLETLPHRKFLDLAVVYYILIERKEEVNISVMVNNGLMKCWDTNEEELYRLAFENTKENMGFTIRNMNELIKELVSSNQAMPKEEIDAILESIDTYREQNNMYVLTNMRKNLGAYGIMYEDVLRKFSEKVGADLYILPSSIHEVIIIPKEDGYEVATLKEMVAEVNVKEVHPMEVLSDRVYEYVYKDNKIIVH